jgi:hypothetical protein
MVVDDFLTDIQRRDAWRWHKLKWDQTGMRLRREHLDWIPSDYRNNDVDFPLFQFQISQALGRVVGFQDETGVFNIVLLDPMHNAQPSDYSNYKIRPTKALECHYTALLARVEALHETIRRAHDLGEAVRLASQNELQNATYHATTAVILTIEDATRVEIEALLDLRREFSWDEIVMAGVEQLQR